MNHTAVANPQSAQCIIDSSGHPHTLMPGLSRSLFAHDKPLHAPGTGYSGPDSAYMAGVRSRVALGNTLIRACSGRQQRSILVVGAGDGAECVWLHAMEDADVIGIDLRTCAEIAPDFWNIEAEADRSLSPDRVRFIEGDIGACDLPEASFDAIYSWQAFEHIMDPVAAMRSIHRLLRPGALAFIEYNPFYSIDGAHWSGTIDIPWAHARLDDADFERALHELHPGRPEWTCRFLRTQVNRMTHADLLAFAADAGLAVEAFLPRVRTEDVMLLNSEILTAIRRLHPRATISDLTSRMVRAVLRRD